ncbi:hypothetical protein BP00DRAFT_428413 [Aspergillus indologenus CBS 114.80]|uniref:Uncharacterized protein n=1 Tax=Aspergillus indologenus CBS 114.80 TaxID=1450541 RepID=A0A2V5I385_9EURO|nr:hypothetical protein BP00DRAFT_428413 [Aspergillus indologenus CBS 114.80]
MESVSQPSSGGGGGGLGWLRIVGSSATRRTFGLAVKANNPTGCGKVFDDTEEMDGCLSSLSLSLSTLSPARSHALHWRLSQVLGFRLALESLSLASLSLTPHAACSTPEVHVTQSPPLRLGLTFGVGCVFRGFNRFSLRRTSFSPFPFAVLLSRLGLEDLSNRAIIAWATGFHRRLEFGKPHG